MNLKYYCYVFCLIKEILSIKLKKSRNNALFLNFFFNIIESTERETNKKNQISLYANKKNEKFNAIKNGIRKHLYSKKENEESVNFNEDILRTKSSTKDGEQSVIPLNMDWIKVMNLIYSSNDVEATTLAFNAALSAVEKKGCLTTILELFETMKRKNVKPDIVSYKLILSLCDKYHLAEHAQILFDEMIETDKIIPNYEIYSIMISCYSKIGYGHKCIEFFEKLRNDPFIEEVRSMNTITDKKKLEKWNETKFVEEDSTAESNYNNQFKEISKTIKNVEKYNKLQYSEYANVIFACNMSNLHIQGVKYFEELLNSGKYIPSIFIYENIFDLLSKNGDYQKCLEYYNKLKNDPNFKKNLNVNTLNNIIKTLSIYNKINIIEDIWNNDFDELTLSPNALSYQLILKVYSETDEYEKALKLFKEMQMKKLLNNKNILPFLYTINSFKNCGMYNYSVYVLRIAKFLAVSGNDLLLLYNSAMISCMNSKKYDVIVSLYAELITFQQNEPSLQININILSFVFLAFRELKMDEDFTNLKNLIIQKNYKLTPLCLKLLGRTQGK